MKERREKVEFKSTLFLLILFLVSVYTSSINEEEEGEREEKKRVKHNTTIIKLMKKTERERDLYTNRVTKHDTERSINTLIH